jgi:hypothetical protein
VIVIDLYLARAACSAMTQRTIYSASISTGRRSTCVTLVTVRRVRDRISACYIRSDEGRDAKLSSGFAFPISSMPLLLQWLTYINPLRYYLIVIRGVLLKGVGLNVLWPEFVAMAILANGLLALSILRFRKTLE